MTKPLETINVGIFGHIDHGKTTLLQKLTGHWADTHSEELKRGITIKLGYADTTISKDSKGYNIADEGTPTRHVSFIDAPGHEMLMATTLSGAALIDAAILVVAANEGLKPQTYEHLMTLQAKKVPHLIVIQNKIDLVNKEEAIKNHKEIVELLRDSYPKAEIIPISAQQEVNVEEVWRAIAEIPKQPVVVDKDPIFLIARSFDINKPGALPKNLHGAVLGGSLKKGTLKVGDELEIKPGRATKEGGQVVHTPLKTKILSLFRGSTKVNELTPGGSMAIETSLDMALGKGDSLGGNLASHIGKLPEPVAQLKLNHTLFPKVLGLAKHIPVEPIKKGEMLMVSINTSITGGSVFEVKGKEISLSLKVPAVFFKGDNIGIARNVGGHWRLIGYGEII